MAFQMQIYRNKIICLKNTAERDFKGNGIFARIFLPSLFLAGI